MNLQPTLPEVLPRFPEILAGGRYELLERIGTGAASEVYRARQYEGSFTRDVCIKRLVRGAGGEHERALQEEARLVAALRHANIVALLDIGQDIGNRPFLVLEYVPGLNLRALCRALATAYDLQNPGFLPDLVAVSVVCGVLRALSAAQRAIPGLVHRDVTPHNVLVSKEGEIKLTDFGIALSKDRDRWTHPKYIKGKFGYMAPEQIRGDALDVRTDLFAVGVGLYELLTRTRPWGSLAPMDELAAVERGDIASIRTRRPRIDRGLAEAVDRLISWRIERRFATADHALRTLAPYGAGDLAPLRLAAIASAACSATSREGAANRAHE